MNRTIVSIAIVLLAITTISVFSRPLPFTRSKIELHRIPLEIDISDHQRREIPEGWSVLNDNPDPNMLTTLMFALKQRNLNVLERTFWEVSDPNSPRYGQFLSQDEVAEMISPLPTMINRVQRWLKKQYRIPIEQQRITSARDMIVIDVPIRVAEEMLQCKYRHFVHENSGLELLRTRDQYSLPVDIAEVVSFVGGVHRFLRIQSMRIRSKTEPSVAAVTPSSIKTWYNISTATGLAPSNTQSVSQFLGQYYSPDDLTKFQKQYNLPQVQPTVAGTNNPKRPGTEASLDIEYIMGVATGVNTYFIYTNGTTAGQEPFLTWITAMNNASDAPITNSVSYGDVEKSLSNDYLNRVNTEFQKFGATGHSLLFASGDSGVGCTACKAFQPDFPASSPFVTAVGGTQLNSQVEVGVGFSGGGFSNTFGQPSYQQAAVSKYLSGSNLPDASFYNRTGRGYPDIAAFATDFSIVVDGFSTLVDGTSCAAPTAAAIISLLNDIRLQGNRQPLGFLNPWLYQIVSSAGAIYDVTSGTNSHSCCKGFNAAAGWDPVTGLGTLNYAVLSKLV